MDRFFIDPDNIIEETAYITGDDAAHILRVLRMKRGDRLLVCDGQGREYEAEISFADKKDVHIRLGDFKLCEGEPIHEITLYQALPKSGKMESIVQKCVELGVSCIIPVETARCVVRPSGFEQKRVRYQRIAYEAAKQSRRGVVPHVGELRSLSDIDCRAHDLVLFANESEKKGTLKEALHGLSAKNIALIIGPEGGFEVEEAMLLIEKGARSITLGKRILRTETAGMALIAMLLYALEG